MIVTLQNLQHLLEEYAFPSWGTKTLFRSLTVSNTGEVVKASAGKVYGYSIQNLHSAAIYVKFYNKATAAASTDTPVRTIQIAANGSTYVAPNCVQIQFPTGLSVRCVTEAADNGTTSPATPPIVEILYV